MQFVGLDIDDFMPMSATHRAVNADFKGDLANSDKGFPCIFFGDVTYDIVLVGGGMSGLAVQCRTTRLGKLVPTVIVTGGGSITKFLENNLVCELLTSTELHSITLWFENETLSAKAIDRDAADTDEATCLALLADKQAKSDAAHENQIAGIEALGGPVKVTRAQPANLRHKDIADVLRMEVTELGADSMLDAVKFVAAQDRVRTPERA